MGMLLHFEGTWGQADLQIINVFLAALANDLKLSVKICQTLAKIGQNFAKN